MFKSLFSSLFVTSVIRSNQTIYWSRCCPVSHVLVAAASPRPALGCARRDDAEAPTHRSSAVLPGCTCLAGGSSKDVEVQGRECLKAEGGGRGGGRKGRRRRVQGRTSRLKSQAQRCSSILPAISYTQKPPPLLAALAGRGSRMRSQLLAADVLLPWQERPNTSSKG